MTSMDGFSGYNQIKMNSSDEKETSFKTLFVVSCYMAFSFGLKNVAATYQREMMEIFKDIQHKTIECDVDDLVVKSKGEETSLEI